MNYFVIGNDGKRYGPVTAEQIRQWIREKRVESRTPVFVGGAADWTFIGLLPEFSAEFFQTPPFVSAPATSHTNSFATWSLVCGILAWMCCCCCIPFNLLGLVFSIIALAQIHSQPQAQTGRGLAIAGLVLCASNLFWCSGLAVLNALNPANFQWNVSNLGN